MGTHSNAMNRYIEKGEYEYEGEDEQIALIKPKIKCICIQFYCLLLILETNNIVKFFFVLVGLVWKR